jgi:hypothetical protein
VTALPTTLADAGTVTAMPSRKKPEEDRPVAPAQIIRRYGLTNNQFDGFRRYHSTSDPKMDVPTPDWAVVAGPAWWTSTIDAWAEYRGLAPAMTWAEACEPQPRKAPPKRAPRQPNA